MHSKMYSSTRWAYPTDILAKIQSTLGVEIATVLNKVQMKK